jgi:ketosteroid isomerase-like protein
MTSWKTLIVCTAWLAMPQAMHGQSPDLKAAAAEIVKADADFARSVADKDRRKFLSFVAEATTFNGGSASELRGRDAVMKEWEDFFAPDGPTLTWQPTKGDVIASGDVGYTTGRSVLKVKGKDGTVSQRLGVYLTVWRKQPDGSWKVVFDTGSTLPQGVR